VVAVATDGQRGIIAGAGSAVITATVASTDNWNAGSVTMTVTVAKGTPVFGAFADVSKTYGVAADASFAFVPPSVTSDGALSYASSDVGVVAVVAGSGGQRGIIAGAGSAVITAAVASTDNWNAGSVTMTVTVAKGTPALSVVGTLSKVYGLAADASFVLLHTSNSDGALAYSSNAAGVATIDASSGVCAVVSVGTAVLSVSQAETANWQAASVSSVLTVAKGTPTIAALSNAYKVYSVDVSFAAIAPASDSSGSITWTSANQSVATVDAGSGVVTIVGVGSTVITANQAASPLYNAGSAAFTLTVGKGLPVMAGFPAVSKIYGNPAFTLSAPTSNSSGVITYSSDNVGVATVVAATGVVTIVGAGSAVLTASQAATANFDAGSITCVLTVAKATPSVSFASIPAKTFSVDASFALSPMYSTGDGTIAYSSGNAGVATVAQDGNSSVWVVTVVGAGTAVITATQAASSNYNAASATATLVVNRGVGTLSAFAAIPDKVWDVDTSFNVPALTTSSDPDAVMYSTSDTAVATVANGGRRITGAGTHANGVVKILVHTPGSFTLRADLPVTPNFTDASGSVSVTVNKAAAVFAAFSIPVKTYAVDVSFVVAAPAMNSSGALSWASSNTAVADICGNQAIVNANANAVVSIAGAGSTVITLAVAETALHYAGSVSTTLVVAKGTPTLSGFTVPTITYDAGITVGLGGVSSPSTGAINYTSSNGAVFTVNGTLITVVGAGSATLTAIQTADANYNARTYTTLVNVLKAVPLLSGFSIPAKQYGLASDASFTLVPPASPSPGAFTYISSNVAVATVSGDRVTLTGAGSSSITATQAATANFSAASTTASLVAIGGGTDLSGFNLSGADISNADLSGTNLSGATLSGANLSGSTLTGSNLSGTNLRGATMAGADMSGSTLRNADLSGANLSGATMTNADLSGAKMNNINLNGAKLPLTRLLGALLNGASMNLASLTSANLSGASMVGASMAGANLSGAVATGANLSGATMTGTVATGANLSGANLTGANLAGSNLTSSSFRGADLSGVIASGVIMRGADLSGAIATGISFVGSDLSGATLSSAYLSGANMSGANLRNANFAGATLAGVDLSGANMTGAVVAGADLSGTELSDAQRLQLLRNSLNRATNEVTSLTTIAKENLAATLSPIAFQNLSVVPGYDTQNYAVLPIPENKVVQVDTTYVNAFVVPAATLEVVTIAERRYYSDDLAVYDADTHEPVKIIVIDGLYFRLVAGSIIAVYMAPMDFALNTFNYTIQLDASANAGGYQLPLPDVSCNAVFYVNTADMQNVFRFQTDASDVDNNASADLHYYTFMSSWPQNTILNPAHAMMDAAESSGAMSTTFITASGDTYASNKNLVKHDFLRYVAHRLFNSVHGLDLIHNEAEMAEDVAAKGHAIWMHIKGILDSVSTASVTDPSGFTFGVDQFGNKYLTNTDASDVNVCREMMMQMISKSPERFIVGENDVAGVGIRKLPFMDGDSFNFKITVNAAEGQHELINVAPIPPRVYNIKIVLKPTGQAVNTAVVDGAYTNEYPH